MNSLTGAPTPAEQLIGRELTNGWMVQELVDRPKNATGGNFSTSYIVRSVNGERAFLKAMDYRRALQAPDPAKTLQVMTAAYNFERDLLEKCMVNRLSRIVRVLDGGTLAAQAGDPSSVVQYLIFELANGDIRSFVDFGQAFDNAWVLRMVHQASAALRQLHYAQIAHQDIKPSNVLVFSDKGSKLADLGRAFDRQSTSPHDELSYAGDPTYAPPELLYEEIHQDWKIRRLACDMYLLGSLIVFFYTGVSITHLLFKRLDKRYHHSNWGDYYGAVLPYLQQVFSQIVRDLRQNIPDAVEDEIIDSIKQLCNPDPQRRGHSKNMSGGDQYSLERYVSLFDRLATRAERMSNQRLLSIREI